MSFVKSAELNAEPRLLMTSDAVGGVWTYALTLSRALCQRGYRVLLATMGPPPSPEQARAARAIPRLELRVSQYRLEWMDDPWPDVAEAGQWLLALEREFNPDVVHLNGYSHANLRFRAPALVVAHSCVLSWWRAVLDEPAPLRYEEYRRRVAAGLASARRVVAPTRAMLEELGRHYGVPLHGLVIPNGSAEVARAHGPKQRFVFAAGRVWDHAKNLELLADLAPRLSWPVKIAGDAQAPDGSTRHLRNVETLGLLSASEMSLRFARAAVFAHPARYEPFGLAPLEAARAGAALLLSDIPSLREVWGDAACYAAPNDRAAWLAQLEMLSSDEVFRSELGERAHARARRYSASLMADRYESLYAQLGSKIRPTLPALSRLVEATTL